MAGGRPVSGSSLLDLPAGLGQRAESVRFDVLNADRSFAFTATQAEASVATVSWDANATTNRTLRGVNFGPRDAARIDPTVHRLAPFWVLDDGTQWQQGLYLFSSPEFPRLAGQTFLRSDLYDQSVILAQPRESSYSLGPYSQILPALLALAAEVGIGAQQIAVDALSPATTGSAPYTKPAGTTRADVMADLCAAAGMYPPYFDNQGHLRLRSVPNPLSSAAPDVAYSTGPSSRIVRDSIVTANNLATAPNRYLVIGSTSSSAEVTGYFDVPANAPHSFERRGFRVVKRVDAQGAADSEACRVAAQAAYATDFDAYDEVRYVTAPDPRADGFQITNFLGTNYREQSWQLPLAPGGQMPHVARKVYQP